MKQYSRVSYETRCQIFALLQVNLPISTIAKQLGFHKSTIYREIKRNRVGRQKYTPSSAQNKSTRRYAKARGNYKLKGEVLSTVAKLIKLDWSADQIANRLRIEKNISLSHECIYQYLRRNRSLYRNNLRRLGKRGSGRIRQKEGHKRSFQPLITERPPIADRRGRLGDWERDIMFTENKRPILVCIDRRSRYVKIAQVENLKALTVNNKTEELLKSTKRRVFTVTNDRGSEFKVPLKKYKTFYCHAQAPQERGTVENQIGLIRQYIKRSKLPKNYGDNLLKEIENKMNLRPRKTLNYNCPYEIFYKKSVALVC